MSLGKCPKTCLLCFGKRHDIHIYRSTQEKSSFFAFTPRTKILKRELSRRKLREISRKLAQTILFLRKFRGETPRTIAEFFREIFAQILRENSESFKKREQFKFLFRLICGFTSQSTTMAMSRRSVNLTTLFLGRFSKRLPVLSAHLFASNWWLPYLNRRQGNNGRRNYSMTNLH